MRTRWVAGVVLLSIVAAGCEDDADSEAAVVDPSTIEVSRAAADPTGGGWLLGSADGETYTVHHVAEDGGFEQVAVVPDGQYFDLLALPDGRLALGGARCDDDCEATVTEVVFIERDGDIHASEELTRVDGNLLADPEYSPDIRIVGEVDGSIWLRASGLRRVSPDGDVEQELDVEGAACVIDGELYELHVSLNHANTVDTTDPIRPDRYTVSRLSGSELVPVDRLDAPAGSWGADCAGDELQVNGSVRRRHYWDPADAWTVGHWVDDPNPAGAMSVHTSDGHVLVVDANGTVMVRRRGQWVDTALRHDLDPELGRQYHAADLSRGALVSCIAPDRDLLLADLSCISATSAQP